MKIFWTIAWQRGVGIRLSLALYKGGLHCCSIENPRYSFLPLVVHCGRKMATEHKTKNWKTKGNSWMKVMQIFGTKNRTVWKDWDGSAVVCPFWFYIGLQMTFITTKKCCLFPSPINFMSKDTIHLYFGPSTMWLFNKTIPMDKILYVTWVGPKRIFCVTRYKYQFFVPSRSQLFDNLLKYPAKIWYVILDPGSAF